MNTLSVTVTALIQELHAIVNPPFEFDMDTIYGDRGGIPYPRVDDLKVLFFRLRATNHRMISVNEQNEILNKVNLFLQSRGVTDAVAELVKIQSIGKFLVVDLGGGWGDRVEYKAPSVID